MHISFNFCITWHDTKLVNDMPSRKRMYSRKQLVLIPSGLHGALPFNFGMAYANL
jgi:hypothetical protein